MGRTVNLAATFQKDVLIFVTLKFNGCSPHYKRSNPGLFYILPKSSTTELSLAFGGFCSLEFAMKHRLTSWLSFSVLGLQVYITKSGNNFKQTLFYMFKECDIKFSWTWDNWTHKNTRELRRLSEITCFASTKTWIQTPSPLVFNLDLGFLPCLKTI